MDIPNSAQRRLEGSLLFAWCLKSQELQIQPSDKLSHSFCVCASLHKLESRVFSCGELWPESYEWEEEESTAFLDVETVWNTSTKSLNLGLWLDLSPHRVLGKEGTERQHDVRIRMATFVMVVLYKHYVFSHVSVLHQASSTTLHKT